MVVFVVVFVVFVEFVSRHVVALQLEQFFVVHSEQPNAEFT